MKIKFEKLNKDHQKPVMEIFNYYIENTTAAFPPAPLPLQFFSLLLEKTKGYPAYGILDTEKNLVIGFCCLSAYNPFPTFKETANISYFISKDYVGMGIGVQCLEMLETQGKQMGIKHLIAEISSENQQSLEFHKHHGFIVCGCLKNIGNKFERNFDIVMVQKDLLE